MYTNNTIIIIRIQEEANTIMRILDLYYRVTNVRIN